MGRTTRRLVISRLAPLSRSIGGGETRERAALKEALNELTTTLLLLLGPGRIRSTTRSFYRMRPGGTQTLSDVPAIFSLSLRSPGRKGKKGCAREANGAKNTEGVGRGPEYRGSEPRFRSNADESVLINSRSYLPLLSSWYLRVSAAFVLATLPTLAEARKKSQSF